MLREAFTERLKQAMRAKDARTLSSVRMILAALKDRDIAARGTGNTAGIPDTEILRLLQGMIKQRRESIALYRQGNRPELAEQEEQEIAVIESFLPKQMSDEETAAAVRGSDRRDRRRRGQGHGQGDGRVARATRRGHRHGPRRRGREAAAG